MSLLVSLTLFVACGASLPPATVAPPSPTAVGPIVPTAPAPALTVATPTPSTLPATVALAPTLTPVPTHTAAPTKPVPTSTAVPKIPLVASFSVLGDLVRNVAGDRADVVVIVGPGQDTHTFEPAPSHALAVRDAAVVFENGAGFDGWLQRLYVASGSRARRVTVTEGITLQRGGHTHAEGEAESHEGEGELDPHVWQDVRHAIHMVGTIRDALAAHDAPGAAVYRANADRYIGELRELDAWVIAQVATVPEPRRTLVMNHESLGYFASRYGFAIVGTVLPSVSTEAAEPSASDLARLVRRIRSVGVPVIFAENVANTRVIERVAREAGARVGPLLYTDALARAGAGADTYVAMMRHNVGAIVTALRG